VDIDVRKIAMLARIRLTDAEASVLGPQLRRILAYVETLREIDTENVPETAHPHDAAMPLRADVVTNTDRCEELLSTAPETVAGLYVVPKVIE